MARSLVERKLADIGDRVRSLRIELALVDEQLAQLVDETEEARMRALISETPLAEREHRETRKHSDAMARHRHDISTEIADLERTQDALLDRLTAVHDPQ